MKYLIVFLFSMLLVGCGHPAPGGIIFHTADPALSFFVPVPDGPTAPPLPDPIVVELEEEEAGQQDCVIAGNVSADGTLIFHVPSGVYYSRVKIDLTRANADGVHEQWFCSESDAEAAGFRKSSR